MLINWHSVLYVTPPKSCLLLVTVPRWFIKYMLLLINCTIWDKYKSISCILHSIIYLISAAWNIPFYNFNSPLYNLFGDLCEKLHCWTISASPYRVIRPHWVTLKPPVLKCNCQWYVDIHVYYQVLIKGRALQNSDDVLIHNSSYLWLCAIPSRREFIRSRSPKVIYLC